MSLIWLLFEKTQHLKRHFVWQFTRFALSLHNKLIEQMKLKVFFGKFASRYLWGNILAMAIVVVVICTGVKYGLEIYTHHGEGIPVPDLRNMTFTKAKMLLDQDGLNIVVSDSGYNKLMPADCILAQSPGSGSKVKAGHTIYVTVNSPSSPSFAIPDLADNSSAREAEAKLTAMGFKLLEPLHVPGEKDWVYGIECRGRRVGTGDRVSIETPLRLVIGSGTYDDEDDDISYTEPEIDTGEASDIDDFEEVTDPLTDSAY